MRDASDGASRTLGARQRRIPEAESKSADSRDDRPQGELRRLGVELAASAVGPGTSPTPGQEGDVTPKAAEAFLDDQRVAATHSIGAQARPDGSMTGITEGAVDGGPPTPASVPHDLSLHLIDQNSRVPLADHTAQAVDATNYRGPLILDGGVIGQDGNATVIWRLSRVP